jgi:hypothetical protein
MRTLEQRVRRKTWQFISPEVVACAGLTIFNLQQFVAGVFHPTQPQVERLARRMQVPQ